MAGGGRARRTAGGVSAWRGATPAGAHGVSPVLQQSREPTAHLAAEDVRDAHLVVVDNVGKVVRWEAVRLAQDKVLQRERLVVDRVVDQVVLRERGRGALRAAIRSGQSGWQRAAMSWEGRDGNTP